LFVFLKYLFPVIKIYYLLLEKYFICMRRTSLLFCLLTCMHQFLFVIFKLCSQCTTFLFVRLNILFAKRYAFVRSNTDVRALWKNIWKIKFSKYSQVWSCFKNLDIRNTMAQSKFNFDIHSGIYGFFCFKIICMWVTSLFYFFYVHTCPFLSACKQ